jgi:hypothetical protein
MQGIILLAPTWENPRNRTHRVETHGVEMSADVSYCRDAAKAQAYVDVMHTMSLYHIGLDEGDFEQVGRTFTENALLEQSNGMQVSGRPAICEAFRYRREKRFENIDRSAVFQRHNLTTRLIEISEEASAQATSYFVVLTEVGLDHCGRYFDRFSLSDGRWLISHRKIRLDWMHEASRFNRTWAAAGAS